MQTSSLFKGSFLLHTIARDLEFRTNGEVKNRLKRTTIGGLNRTIKMYNTRGFNVTHVFADNEFECTRNDLLPCSLNVAAPKEHVPEIEMYARIVKESIRCTSNGLPLKRLPKMLVTSMVTQTVTNLNNILAENDISSEISPLTIIVGRPSPDYKILISIPFCSYAQVNEDNEPRNDNQSRTTGAIALHPSGNEQCSFYFMSLNTGRRLHRKSWTPLPMGKYIITAVEAMAEIEGQPLLRSTTPLFEWKLGTPMQSGAPPLEDDLAYEKDPLPDEEEYEGGDTESHNELSREDMDDKCTYMVTTEDIGHEVTASEGIGQEGTGISHELIDALEPISDEVSIGPG